MAGFRGMNKYKKTVNKAKNDLLHRVTKKAFENLVITSPVDIGNFRGSWLAGVLAPRLNNPYDTVDQSMSISKGQPPNSFEISNLAPAMRAIFGQTVFITNNVAYAQKLENGGSRQAPGGVLRVSAQKTRAHFANKGVKL